MSGSFQAHRRAFNRMIQADEMSSHIHLQNQNRISVTNEAYRIVSGAHDYVGGSSPMGSV
ncbi:hypothetical protein KIN20_001603 [Parelaphostrongylus tenuis]|uniref:Uncharacterized protein n=1 Tax=Parelaphostrongylus tenuis TaxID=148309 RepID=A0AAD5MF76_PARTN|nr:hypothetical protein KIN20_001603 [Parelaphostrongylus tenuis]